MSDLKRLVLNRIEFQWVILSYNTKYRNSLMKSKHNFTSVKVVYSSVCTVHIYPIVWTKVNVWFFKVISVSILRAQLIYILYRWTVYIYLTEHSVNYRRYHRGMGRTAVQFPLNSEVMSPMVYFCTTELLLERWDYIHISIV